ncbi:unnamed protein product [Rhizophagus irregularis]|nr:unnamed protein product [Rhizophagus irregularis]
MENEVSKLNISDGDTNIVNNQKNCSYCNKSLAEELWCKECDPFRMIEGWTSGNPDIDKLIGSQNIKNKFLSELKIHWKVYFGLCGPSSKDNGVYYGVVPYIAPEVLSGTQYELSSDIYSFGVVMTELSTGRRPFCNENYDSRLIFAICINGLRPEFGKGTPEFYEELAYKCMNENPNERPTAEELFDIFNFWLDSIRGRKDEEECFSYKGKEIKDAFEEADKEISNISTSYKKGF